MQQKATFEKRNKNRGSLLRLTQGLVYRETETYKYKDKMQHVFKTNFNGQSFNAANHGDESIEYTAEMFQQKQTIMPEDSLHINW